MDNLSVDLYGKLPEENSRERNKRATESKPCAFLKAFFGRFSDIFASF